MPIYGPPVATTGVTVDSDGFLVGGDGLPIKATAEPLVGDPFGATRRIKILVKDLGVQKEAARADK